jgi:hypothetical protein
MEKDHFDLLNWVGPLIPEQDLGRLRLFPRFAPLFGFAGVEVLRHPFPLPCFYRIIYPRRRYELGRGPISGTFDMKVCEWLSAGWVGEGEEREAEVSAEELFAELTRLGAPSTCRALLLEGFAYGAVVPLMEALRASETERTRVITTALFFASPAGSLTGGIITSNK